MGSGMMGFGAGAVAGAALGELCQVYLCYLTQCSNYRIVSSTHISILRSLSDQEQVCFHQGVLRADHMFSHKPNHNNGGDYGGGYGGGSHHGGQHHYGHH